MNKFRARALRKNLTEAERSLWRELRFRQMGGYKFRRQQPLGGYIVDFVCFEKRLIVEVDGGQHSEQIEHDLKRDEWLKAQGFPVLRFWNSQVIDEIRAVKEIIHNSLERKVYPPP
ncbi:MAG: endonuclease domain-containing protein [Deltaproteobacteria bacterium]|nr:endonuclease domain-containing protein [Deltaproteobacteria bacterium]